MMQELKTLIEGKIVEASTSAASQTTIISEESAAGNVG